MSKVIFDKLFALFLIALFLPVYAVISLLIYLKMGKPILFRQKRPGLSGKVFNIYKFRTMTNERNDSGELLPDKERLPSLGRYIRSLSLDELPQLFNVLKGEMSFVGPRPLLVEYLPLYDDEQKRRHDVKPGITGWAQVNGRNALSWEDKFKLDVWYVDNQSLWLDLKILLLTVKKVVKRDGISNTGEATVSKFTGNQS